MTSPSATPPGLPGHALDPARMPTSRGFSGKIGASGGPDAGSKASMGPDSPIPDMSPHRMADHPRPPRLHFIPTRPRRTPILGSAPRAADRSDPGSPRITPGARPPP